MDYAPAIVLALFACTKGFDLLVDQLNVKRLENPKIPHELADVADADFLHRSAAYTRDTTKVASAASAASAVVFALFVFAGPLEAYDRWVASFGLAPVPSALVFFLPLVWADAVLSIPFRAYRVFVVEKRHGFSTTTPARWLADLLKSAFLSTVFTALVAAAGMAIVVASPGWWWLWVWAFFLALGLFVMYVSPWLIEPIFNKFTPVEDEGLVRDIKALMERAGIRVEKVVKMDASRRTRHSNAYFSGIGGAKRIVLFDTLLESLTRGGVLAVLAHEAGHWRKGHIVKRLAAMEAALLAALYASYRLIESGLIEGLFPVSGATFPASVMLVLFLFSVAGYPLGPLFNWLSRRDERQADSFASRLTGDPASLAGSLKRLTSHNLGNPDPHPLYVAMRYSHPPVAERIRGLEEEAG